MDGMEGEIGGNFVLLLYRRKYNISAQEDMSYQTVL
jgi:hypothetical protein